MSEQLGEAVLVLRTDDRGLDTGIDKAEGKSKKLGSTLDATSGSATRMGKAVAAAGRDAEASSGGMDRAAASADRLTVAQKKVTSSAGEQRQGMRQLGQQLGDASTMWALGAKPMQIFASQSDQVIQAVQLMTGGTSKLGAFMGGPWGMAITTGALVLVPLITNLLDSKDAADKSAKANETLTDKLDRTKHSYEEVVKALRDYNAEQRKAKETTLESAQAAAIAANKSIQEALALRTKLQAQLDGAMVTAQRNAGQGTGGAAGQMAQVEVASLQSQIQANNRELGNLATQARDAVGSVADELAKMDSDPTVRIRAGFKVLRDDAHATIRDVQQLRQRLADLDRQEKAQIDDARKAGRSPSEGDQASVGDMTALLKQLFGAGTTISDNSKHSKFTADGKVSDHWGPNARALDFVPQGGMARYTSAQVEQMLRDAGVDIRRNATGTEQFFGPGRGPHGPNDTSHDGHFHVAWQGSPSPEAASRRAEAAAKKAEEEREKQVRRDKAFADADAQLDDQLLDAKRKGMSDEDAIAQVARDRVKLADDKFKADQLAKVQTKDLTQVQADELIAKHKLLADLQIQLIDSEQQASKLKDAADVALQMSDLQLDVLHAQENLAQTTTQRRDLALEILAEEEKQARLAAERTIALSQLAGATADQVKAAQAAQRTLDNLDKLHPLRVDAVNQQNQGPLDRYLSDTNPQKNDERVERYFVDRVEQFNQSMTDAVSSVLGVEDPLLKSLISMFIEQNLIRPMMEALQSSKGGGGGGGLLGTLFSLGGSLLGGGGPKIGGLTGSQYASGIGSTISSWTPSNFAGLFASGGLIPNGGFGIVGENGPEPIFATGGGVGVLPNSAMRPFEAGRGGDTFNSTYIVPERTDSRATRSAVARGQQLAMGRAYRKGLAG